MRAVARYATCALGRYSSPAQSFGWDRVQVNPRRHSLALGRSAIAAFHFVRRPPIFVLSAWPTMAINGRWNKPFGPGGGTRRLHQKPLWRRRGFCWGRNRIDEGV